MSSLTIIQLDTFHRSEGDICIPCAGMSFKKQNYYIAENLIDAVYSPEDYCASNMNF